MRWRKVEGFDHYYVSEFGDVLSLCRKQGRFLKQHIQHGYLVVQLKRKGECSTRYAHRLVIEAFYGLPSKCQECRHLDGNRLNNNIRNLQWGTHPANMADMIQHGHSTTGEFNPNAKLTVDQVSDIRSRYTGAIGQQTQLAEEFGVSIVQIHNIVKRVCWKDDDQQDNETYHGRSHHRQKAEYRNVL